MLTNVFSEKVAIATLFSLTSVGVVIIWNSRSSTKSKRRPGEGRGDKVKSWKRVGVVDKLVVHPLKSGQPLVIDEAYVDHFWLRSVDGQRDRSFMIVDADSGRYLNARSNPRIILIRLEAENGIVRLRELNNAVDPVEFKVPKTSQKGLTNKLWDLEVTNTKDCGDAAAEWISNFVLGRSSGARLMFYEDNTYEPQRPIRPKWSKIFPTTFDETMTTGFADCSPIMMTTRASYDDLNSKVGNPVNELRFRSNIIVKTEDGEPFAEDKWTDLVKIGDEAILSYGKPCNRCLSIQIDPETGKVDHKGDPTKTLKTYRTADKALGLDWLRKTIGDSTIFGANFGTIAPGNIKLGSEVFIPAEYHYNS